MALHVLLMASLTILEADGRRERFLVINAASVGLEMRWLQHGVTDKGEGVVTGHVAAGSAAKPATLYMDTSPGHAFVLSRGSQRSKAFAYGSGLLSVAAVSSVDTTIDVEVLGADELRLLSQDVAEACASAKKHAACIEEHSRSPRLKVPMPRDAMDAIMEEWSPDKLSPSLITDDAGSRPLGADGLLLISSSPSSVQIRWLRHGKEQGDTKELKKLSQEIWKLPPGAASSVSYAQLKADAKHRFYVESESKASSPSKVFEHPGEFAVAGISEAGGAIEVELIDEDSLKLLVSDVARDCANEQRLPKQQKAYSRQWEQEIKKCFALRARLPRTGVMLPQEISLDMFEKLWSTWNHWRLCSYQDVAVPVKEVTFTVAEKTTSSLTVQVLRENPLVIAVPAFASSEECKELTSQAGDNLVKATVGGEGKTSTSRARRTLSKNLFPDLDDENSTLTRMAYRFFEVARQATGYEIFPEGQEPVNWLFYKPGYEYRPHCDGACGTTTVKQGGRVASSLLYCNVASDGGGTVFPDDNLKLEPTAGMFMLFAYNPDPKGLSKHAACPVLKGSKTTATQWYREGVSSETPWDRFENWGSFAQPQLGCSSFTTEASCPPRCEWRGTACSRKARLEAATKHPEL